ncbi:hypothetical protein FSP39_020695 [Pinctada imbricata]|uniref:Uncharacterized protein n=1 Tax=Pinctada imbricata TaxID=66713 RepID=A0AA88Y2T2_PINIB|nr:hypothetical protein FSP39_020695 [Pinctada imbricata]
MYCGKAEDNTRKGDLLHEYVAAPTAKHRNITMQKYRVEKHRKGTRKAKHHNNTKTLNTKDNISRLCFHMNKTVMNNLAYFIPGTSFSIAKAMFSILSGYDVGPVRLPLTDMTQNEKDRLRNDLQDNEFV